MKNNRFTVQSFKNDISKMLLAGTIILSASAMQAQIVINELIPGATIEIKNLGTESVDISSYWLCNFPNYSQLSDLNVSCGSLTLASGATVAIDDFDSFSESDGEIGIYTTDTFSSSNAMIDYVEWGSTGHERSSVAVDAGLWTTGDFAPVFASDKSLSYDGEGDNASDWAETDPTLCAENIASSIDETVAQIDLNLELFPNPTLNQFQIKAASNIAEKIDIKIYNSLGEAVKNLNSVSSANGVYTVDVSSLEAGNYLVSIHSFDRVQTKRIIKLP